MNELKVGILALVTMAVIVAMSFKITSNQSGFGEYVPYRTIVRDASGIFPKTPIKVAGINAGRIQNIELLGNQALITFEVLEKVVITEGSVLKIKSVGFLGDKYLEILVGESEKRLSANQLIAAEEGAGIEGLVKDASDVMKDVKVIVQSLKDSIAPADREPPIKQILTDVEEATESLKNIFSGNEESINTMIKNLEKFAKDLSYQMDSANKDSLINDAKKLGEVLDNAKTLTKDLSDIVADIKKGKGTVGKLLVEEDIADEVRETLASVKRVVSRVDQIRTELAVFTGANSESGGTTEASLKIFPSPERFYLLGMTTSKIGPVKERETTTSVNGVETKETQRVVQKDTYRFNVQLGRKLHQWTFRGGLIESSGGLGLDYDIDRWGMKFSMEVFDYRKDVGVNFRLASELHLWNVFYGRVAAEDMIQTTRSYSLSAGLRFTDEDLKGLIGFFF